MPFTSRLYPNEFVIDDFHAGSVPRGQSRGRVPRDWHAQPYGSVGAEFDSTDLIPESEWSDRIEEMEKTQTRVSDHILGTYSTGTPVISLDQNGTNYCWFNAVVTALTIIRQLAGLPYLQFSPASGAAPIKNFSNQGGWGGEALDWMVKNGVNTVDEWPPNAISRSYYTADNKDKARRNIVLEWNELQNRNFSQLMSYVLHRRPVAIGLNWWSHEICACDGVKLGSNSYGIRIRNSWGDSYGEKGFAVLTQSKATPDDACSPRAPTPTFS